MSDNPVIDAQVHAYERDRPTRPWIGFLHGPAEVTGDDMVAAMDRVGVDGALLVSPYSMYRYDASYALEVYAKHPNRFGLIRPFDPQAENVVEQVVDWASREGTVGARIMLPDPKAVSADDPGLNRILEAGERADIPVNVLCWGNPQLVRGLAQRNPATQIVVDHLGLRQPFEPPPPDQPFADLSTVLTLAEFENVAIKITGACTLSHEEFPFRDVWSPVKRILDTFGIDRCLWGTDWTRAVNLLTYDEGVNAFEAMDFLSMSDRAALMGENVVRIYGWNPDSKSN